MGVVGMGIGGGHGATIHGSDAGELTAICDNDPEKLKWRLETYAEEIDAHPTGYGDMEEMLQAEQLDGVVISTPSGLHHEQALVAAAHGVNMLIDKPIDIALDKIDVIDKAVARAKVRCGVNYQMRWNRGYRAVKKAIDAGAFGKLLLVDVRLKWYRDQAYYDRGGWRGTWAMDGGGSLMNQGAHPMDLLTWYAGRPVKVRGDFAALNHQIETEDWAAGIVEFANGVRSCVTTTTNAAPKNDRCFIEVHGTEGSAWLVDGEIVETGIESLKELPEPEFASPVEDFMDAIANGRDPEVTVEQARRSVALILGVYESARQGRTVQL
jgi:predicted dehydrogenase